MFKKWIILALFCASPFLAVGQSVGLVLSGGGAKGLAHIGVIKALEENGVGRPSTYASIISVIQERGYALRDGGSLRPTLLGQMVVRRSQLDYILSCLILLYLLQF